MFGERNWSDDMLGTNWSEGSARDAGKAYVIRNRLGRAAPRKSRAAHTFMRPELRQALIEKLEREAAKAR
jgi:hypothetical protein